MRYWKFSNHACNSILKLNFRYSFFSNSFYNKFKYTVDHKNITHSTLWMNTINYSNLNIYEYPRITSYAICLFKIGSTEVTLP